jgi:uncharacterized repeat protein (TIGR04076 family)
MYDLRIVVEDIKGFCDLPMKVGDYFEVIGGKIIIPEGKYICLWALQSIMPLIPLKQRELSEKNDWVNHTKRISCPDPNGLVLYRLDRIDPKTKRIIADEKENIEVKKRILVDETKRSGCRACESVCSFSHNNFFSNNLSRINVEKNEELGIDKPLVCRQCGNALCVSVCPVNALTRDERTHAVLLNREKCISCGKCKEACPFDSITFNEEGFPLICDLCGGDPECVKRCATGAIAFSTASNKE